MQHVLMECGHVAQGVDANGNPVCVICWGIRDGADKPVQVMPDLTGRNAKCYCGKMRASRYDLPFFNHRPDRPYDEYYCGHDGWD